MKHLAYLALLALACALSYRLGRASHQNVNELIRAGFVVTDPDGYTIERFDDSATLGYWTTEPKE